MLHLHGITVYKVVRTFDMEMLLKQRIHAVIHVQHEIISPSHLRAEKVSHQAILCRYSFVDKAVEPLQSRIDSSLIETCITWTTHLYLSTVYEASTIFKRVPKDTRCFHIHIISFHYQFLSKVHYHSGTGIMKLLDNLPKYFPQRERCHPKHYLNILLAARNRQPVHHNTGSS